MRKNRLIATEEEEHLALIEWLDYFPDIKSYLLHIPNQGIHSLNYRKKLTKMGLKKGVSDFFLAYPTKTYHGLWIELKRKEKFNISTEQQEWIVKMKSKGYAAYFAYGWEHARYLILTYLES
jgi:hypothetical protein